MCGEVSMANGFKFLDLIIIKVPIILSIISIVGIDPFGLQLEELKILRNTFCGQEIAGYIVISTLGFPLHSLLNCAMPMPVAELMVCSGPDLLGCSNLSQILVRQDPPWLKAHLSRGLKPLGNLFCSFSSRSDPTCIEK
jgi:hypothetical protein